VHGRRSWPSNCPTTGHADRRQKPAVARAPVPGSATRITPVQVGRIAAALDAAGVEAIEVAHGDGLAGGSLTYGPGSSTDWEWIEAAVRNVERAVLTTLLLPGIGTIAELRQAHSLGVRSVRWPPHCSVDVATSPSTCPELGAAPGVSR
jgi:4-hydroxy 2-oxovalerate aldolase